jgi:hypothetical protein
MSRLLSTSNNGKMREDNGQITTYVHTCIWHTCVQYGNRGHPCHRLYGGSVDACNFVKIVMTSTTDRLLK